MEDYEVIDSAMKVEEKEISIKSEITFESYDIKKEENGILLKSENPFDIKIEKEEALMKSENSSESYEYGIKQVQSIIHEHDEKEPRDLSCGICKENFNSEIDLIYHKNDGVCYKEENDVKLYMPEVVLFEENDHGSDMEKYGKTSAGEKPTHCKTCLKPFTRKCGPLWHKMTHTGKKPYACKSCPKSFIQRCDLLRHKTTHTGEKPFQCTLCSKSFSLKYNLMGHEKIHKGLKLFYCEVCLKSFTKKFDLTRHQMTHTGDKPFQCRVCLKFFARNFNLVRHEKTHSGG